MHGSAQYLLGQLADEEPVDVVEAVRGDEVQAGIQHVLVLHLALLMQHLAPLLHLLKFAQPDVVDDAVNVVGDVDLIPPPGAPTANQSGEISTAALPTPGPVCPGAAGTG